MLGMSRMLKTMVVTAGLGVAPVDGDSRRLYG
jgi:hypothetical protein